MQIVVDKILTAYEKVGKGPVILLLHGWGDSSVTFRQLSAQLKADFTVVAVDLPGFGQTEAPPGVWRLDDYAKFVHDFLRKIDASPHAIIAHSNGGSVAIRGLAHHVLSADKLVLLASAGIRDRQKFRRFFLKVIAKLGKLFTFWLPAHQKKVLQKKLYGAAGSDMLVAPHLQETFKITVRQDVQRDARKLELPVLLIYGDADRATPPLYGEIYQKLIPNSRLEVIKAEHFVHHDQPKQVSVLIKEFLNEK